MIKKIILSIILILSFQASYAENKDSNSINPKSSHKELDAALPSNEIETHTCVVCGANINKISNEDHTSDSFCLSCQADMEMLINDSSYNEEIKSTSENSSETSSSAVSDGRIPSDPEDSSMDEDAQQCFCENCGEAAITDDILNYCKLWFGGRALCLPCQQKIDGKRQLKPHTCQECNTDISDATYDYCITHFSNKVLCIPCQCKNNGPLKPYICQECGHHITSGVFNYSCDKFGGDVYCMRCQIKMKKIMELIAHKRQQAIKLRKTIGRHRDIRLSR